MSETVSKIIKHGIPIFFIVAGLLVLGIEPLQARTIVGGLLIYTGGMIDGAQHVWGQYARERRSR